MENPTCPLCNVPIPQVQKKRRVSRYHEHVIVYQCEFCGYKVKEYL